jgi:uncharacterized iron-regulated membrane protein
LRRIIFWTHLSVGLVAGLVVFIMAVTGVLLTYEKQILAWADRPAGIVPRAPDAVPLGVEALLDRVKAVRPEAVPATILLRADRDEPAAISLGREGTVFVDRYTGVIMGEGSPGTRRFFRIVTDWHRWLGREGPSRTWGKAITGACNLAFLFLVISGPYLWLPRQWNWRQVRSVIWFRRGLPGKARDFNWHNVIGVWSAIPLAIVVASATVISYPWASNLAYRLAGDTPPQPPARPSAPPSAPTTRPDVTGIDGVWPVAQARMAGWRTITLRLPASPRSPLVFTIDWGTGGEPQKRGTLTVDRATGGEKWEPFSAGSAGRQFRTILRFAHTGEVGGLAGQTIAGIASAGAAVLVWTGLALTWRRFVSARRSARRAKDAVEEASAA